MEKVNEVAKSQKAIKDYWVVVLENFFQDDFSEEDKKIGKHIVDIETNITFDKLEIFFEFENNEYFTAGRYSRRFFLDQGLPAKS